MEDPEPEPEPDPLRSFLILRPPNSPGSIPSPSPLPHQSPDPHPPPADLQAEGPHAPGLDGTAEIEAAKNPVNGELVAPVPASMLLLDHQSHSSQAPLQPASPTLMDQELQEKAWSLLPDLAKDLQKFKNQEPVPSSWDGRPACKPLKSN